MKIQYNTLIISSLYSLNFTSLLVKYPIPESGYSSMRSNYLDKIKYSLTNHEVEDFASCFSVKYQ